MPKSYKITPATGSCCKCSREFEEGQDFVAAVREEGEELVRDDYCSECWPSAADAGDKDYFAIWQAKMPQKQEKKKLFVDDDVLSDFFVRLGDQPERVSFRFVLALVLMRKKILSYEGATRKDGRDVWLMRFKGDKKQYEVTDPHMTEEKISQVSRQLGQILAGEL